MESTVMNWVISLVTGGVGGNIAGALLKKISLGPIGNTIAGLVGGGVGGQLLSSVLGSGAPAGIGGQVAGSGVGGIVVMLVVGLIKRAMSGTKQA